MKENYTVAELEIIRFDTEDIITASPATRDPNEIEPA